MKNKEKWLKEMIAFSRSHRAYHRKRAKTHPEEYPDYKENK